MYDILVIATVLGCGWLGFRYGLQAAVVAALELLACLAIATVAHEPLISLIDDGFQMVLGPLVPQSWLIPVVFAALLWGGFALIRRGLHRDEQEQTSDDDDGAVAVASRIAGAIAAGLGGLLLAGAALVTFSMVPLLSGFKPVGDRMFIDAGRIALEAGGLFAGDRHEGRSLVLHGEPVSRSSILSAGLTSEPWLDMDGDSTPTEADRFRDLDENGAFSADLYYTDVDGDRMRRIGMLDKYACGCWTSALNHDDRPRPVEKKPAAVKPPVIQAKPEAAAAPQNPSASEPKTQASEPKTQASEPKTQANEPKTQASEPKTQASEPKTQVSGTNEAAP